MKKISLRLPKYTYLNSAEFIPVYYLANTLEDVWWQLILLGFIHPFTVKQGFKHGKYNYNHTYYTKYCINVVTKDWYWLMKRHAFFEKEYNFPYFKNSFLSNMTQYFKTPNPNNKLT